MGRNRGRPREVVSRRAGEGLPVGWRPSDLPPTTRAILLAAKQRLLREGTRGFSMAAVAREAHVDVTTVAYHFRTRDGLIEALLDYLYAEPVADLIDQAGALADPRDRWHAYVSTIRTINEAAPNTTGVPDDTQVYFDIAALALRSESLRTRLADLQSWKVSAFLAELGPQGFPDAQVLGEFIFAAVDGIELHHALAGDSFPLEQVLTILESLIDPLLDRAEDSGRNADGRPTTREGRPSDEPGAQLG